MTTGETDEDGLEIWVDDPESCVEVEKTECKVQEIPVADEEEKEGTADVSGEEEETTNDVPSTTTPEEVKKDNSAIIFFPED